MVVVSILVKGLDKGLQVDAAVSGREGFIELTKDGFRMTSPVTLEEGLHLEGDILMTGNWMYVHVICFRFCLTGDCAFVV